MKFIDHVSVQVRAGNGGNGRVSYRHEKFIDKGGADGGNGGKGGDVIFVASRNVNTLVAFRYHRELVAPSGNPGDKRRKNGRGGKDLLVIVPVGTLITTKDDSVMVDLLEDGQQAVVAKGGRGGFGNAHFVSSVRQTPGFAEKGEEGNSHELELELKLIADVGLVGLPNAGKSTLLSVVSNARPEIADYPFTTLTPNLGVVDIDKQSSLLFADIPGLIEGASTGKGLGDEFLRHVERTAVILHLVDAGSDDIVRDYKTIQNELKTYRTNLAKKRQLVVISKIDTVTAEVLAAQRKLLQKALPKAGKLFAVSSPARLGLAELLQAVRTVVQEERQRQIDEVPPEASLPVLRLKDESIWEVKKVRKGFAVTGKKLESFAARTDFENEEGVQRLRVIMRKQGIMHELVRHGVVPGDTIHIGPHKFIY